MDVGQIVKKKVEMQMDIHNMIRNFEASTGATVESIELSREAETCVTSHGTRHLLGAVVIAAGIEI